MMFDSTEGFAQGMDGFHGERKGLFGGDMFRLASNHTGTRAHLQRINVVQDALCQCAAEIDHGSSIRDILATHNIVALMLIFEYTQRTWVCTSSQMPTKLPGPIIYRV
jgi:hypothetical protein